MREYYVYILASASKRLYVGATNNLVRRLWQHRSGCGSEFAARYRIVALVHYETTGNPYSAISREKQIKGWRREKKIALIESRNPDWRDLAKDWHVEPAQASRPR